MGTHISSQIPDANGPRPAPRWTVMVFMGAATIQGAFPMDDAAEADLAEMRFIGSGPSRDNAGQNRGELNIFVQIHKGPDFIPRRERVTARTATKIDALPPVPEAERDPKRGRALEHFIRTSLMAAQHSAANPNHYSMLVLWGHAYDFAIGRAQTTDGMIDPLDFAELYRVLERLQLQVGVPDAKLDILGFDACDLSTVEMAYQLEPFASYLLSSEIGIPIPGWPYADILERLRYPFGSLMNAAEFGSYIVRRYCESYSREHRTVSLTMLDLSRAQELAKLAGFLALTIFSAIADPDVRNRIASLFVQSQTQPRKPFVDVATLCLNLVRRSGDPLIAETAGALGDFLISPPLPRLSRKEDFTGLGNPFIVEHGRNAGEAALLNGIAIYAPHVAPERDYEAVRHLYHDFFFALETRWSELVHALADWTRNSPDGR